MTNDQILDWLLDGDVAVQYQVKRDLLGLDDPALRQRIASEGWGCALPGRTAGERALGPGLLPAQVDLLPLHAPRPETLGPTVRPSSPGRNNHFDPGE